MFGSSHISQHDLQGPIDQAKEVLQGLNDKSIEILWDWLGRVFQVWKSQHGQPPQRGGGLLTSGPAPELFDEAEPYQCAGLGISNNIDLALKLRDDDYKPFLEVIEAASLARVLAALILKEATPVNAASVFKASELLRKIKEADNKRVMAQLKKLAAAGLKQEQTLASGRLAGGKTRQETAKEKQATLTKAIADLFDKPEKPGWGWTNPEIGKFLKGTVGYADGTIMQAVKLDAAKFRKARKEQQASKLPNR